MKNLCLLALGSNLASGTRTPSATLGAALARLNGSGVFLVAVSRFFHTPCFPPGAGPDYVNACVSVRTDLSPRQLLDRLHEIEQAFGRERVQRWGMRTLDLDLIACGDKVLPDADTQTRWRDLSAEDQVRETPPELILPHPRLQDRAFVLVPLLDIAAEWRHPLTGQSVAEMCAALPQEARNEVVCL